MPDINLKQRFNISSTAVGNAIFGEDMFRDEIEEYLQEDALDFLRKIYEVVLNGMKSTVKTTLAKIDKLQGDIVELEKSK